MTLEVESRLQVFLLELEKLKQQIQDYVDKKLILKKLSQLKL